MTLSAEQTSIRPSYKSSREDAKDNHQTEPHAKADVEAGHPSTDPPASSSTPSPQVKELPFSIYTSTQKTWIVLLVSFAATFSGFASNIYFPSIPTIASDLSSTVELINLTVTGYLIFQGLSPTIWGAVSDTYGRRITYISTFTVFIGACIGLAETKSYTQLLVLRCLQSTGSASTIAIGAGVVGDISTRAERGGYMGYFQAGLLLPVAFGPLIGGALADSLGWRAIFWFLAIYAVVFLLVLIMMLPETLRSLVGDGSVKSPAYAASPMATLLRKRVTNSSEDTLAPKKPVNLLGSIAILIQRQATFSILFIGLYYMVWQMVVTVLSSVFKATYGMSDLQVGFVYIANGVGCILGTMTTGKLLDADYRRCTARYSQEQDFPLEKVRLRMVWFYGPLQCTAVLIFGWVVDRGVHVSVPIICLFFIGWAATSIQSVVSTFLVDLYPERSASATAALNIVRCLLGAAGTAAVSPCINAIGVGWTFTLFTGMMILGAGFIAVQFIFGPSWRVNDML